MRNITKRTIILVVIFTLIGCKSFGLIGNQSSSNEASARPTPASVSPDTVSTEPSPIEPSPTEPAPTEAASTETVALPKLQVAVLVPNDFTNARARHKQALSESFGYTLAGTDVGYYMDIQEARFVQLLRNSRIDIKHEADIIILKMLGSDSFSSGSTRLVATAMVSLTSISRVLDEFNKTQITIYGHTDDVGDEDYNQKLSVRRAMSVAQHLVDHGIVKQRIAIVGFGESQPVSPNTTDEGRTQNRRIELQLAPVAK
ncbi:MAG: OmpA family protein [Gammaproteobacteria bacterium]|nr:OmpA family protein [Gammaproteobacteria bacterium]